MNRNQLAVLIVAVVIMIAMLLYPPFMMGLTGDHMGYYFAFQLPAMVSAFGRLDTGLLLMQIGLVCLVAGGAILALRTHDD